MPKKQKCSIWFRLKRDRVGVFYALPYLLLFFLFTFLPALASMFFSLTQFNMISPPQYVFIDNYIRLFLKDDLFLISIRNTFIIAAVTGPVGYFLCFFFAWCINELKPAMRSAVTLCFFAPSISGNAYLIWTLLFNGDNYGYINGFLLKLNLISEPIRFFNDTKYMMGVVILVILWMSLGTSLLVFVAGFQGIDHTLYEAAAVDGIKNRWQELWYVTLPSMRPQLMFGAVMSITASFGVGDVITGLVGFPSTGYAVNTLTHMLQDYGGMRFEMGYASAIATFLFAVMIGANVFVQKIIGKVGQS